MTVRCWSMGDQHKDPWVHCDFCDQAAVFHWRESYPDLLLCADCLESYPEAQGGGLVLSHDNTEENGRSGTAS